MTTSDKRVPRHPDERPDIPGSAPFLSVHLGALLVLVVEFSWFAVAVCAALYLVRMFAITAGFHRYFSHRTYSTSRWFQFVLAFLGTMSAQMGPLWWAAHHRHHHKHSDTEDDIHSPGLKGFFWAHMGWVLCKRYVPTDYKAVPDWAKYPELVWLNRYHFVAPLSLAVGLVGLGFALDAIAPALGAGPWTLLAWGFFLSTVLLYHGTFCINSLAHVFGKRRFDTHDDSKNSLLLALITLGEGWHNNHHYCPYSERQGFYWWELDISHYVLTAMSWVGLVWDIKKPPRKVYEAASVT